MNSNKYLLKFLSKDKFKRIFIIRGNKSFTSSGVKKILDQIKKKKIKYFIKKSAYPDFLELKSIISKINVFTPDLIIAIGGGTIIDYAKIANALRIDKNTKSDIQKSIYKLFKKTRVLAIPTTAGSGAEVTNNAVIYIDKIKYSIEGDEIKPDNFFLIPKLILPASKKIKASSGFDAIAQAIESLLSKKSNKQSIKYAEKSLKLSFKNYLENLYNPTLKNTFAMCLAANLAGKAINISKTTAPHAVSYPFTSFFKISHGHAVSLTLHKFLKFNYDKIKYSSCKFDLKKRFNILFKISNSNNIKDFLNFIVSLKRKANLEDNFEKLGINISIDLKKIIKNINLQRLSNNPINLTKNDIKKIIQS